LALIDQIAIKLYTCFFGLINHPHQRYMGQITFGVAAANVGVSAQKATFDAYFHAAILDGLSPV
jgi:hypothetical protein